MFASPRLCLIVLALLAGSVGATAPADSLDFQSVLDSLRTALGVPGAAAAVLLPDGTLWTGASGIAAPGVPATPAHVFEIGSVTKSYTAALVLTLAAEGLLELDAPLGTWKPDFPGAEQITIRHLLQQTSGLPDYYENPAYLDALRADFGRTWTPEESYVYLGEPHFAPGEGWHYANANYHLLGQIVEAVTGQSLHEALRKRLLVPQGLAATSFAPVEAPCGEPAHAFLDINGDGTPEDLTALVPGTSFQSSAGAAGALRATAVDLARWARVLWGGAVVQGSWFEAMTDGVERGDGMQYGFGVILTEHGGHPVLGHKGNTAGFSASVWHLPDANVTVAVLTNAHALDVTPLAFALAEKAP